MFTRLRRLSFGAVLGVFVVGVISYELSETFRTTLRWALFAHSYETQVLAQEKQTGLQHIEWDGWGFAGSDTTEYLVFDPRDILKNEQPNKVSAGLFAKEVCPVDRIRRLRQNWYVVRFYTESAWENCTG